MTRETIAKIVKASGVSAGALILIHFWGENVDAAFAQLGRMTLNAKGERFLKTGLDVPAACALEVPGNPVGRQRFYGESGEFLAVGSVQGETLNIEKRFFVIEPVKQTGETAF